MSRQVASAKSLSNTLAIFVSKRGLTVTSNKGVVSVANVSHAGADASAVYYVATSEATIAQTILSEGDQAKLAQRAKVLGYQL